MKGPVIERLARKHLLPKLGDDFVARCSLVYRRPVEHLLYAIAFRTFGFTSSRIYVQFSSSRFSSPPIASGSRSDSGLATTWDVDEGNLDPTFAKIAGGSRARRAPVLRAAQQPRQLLRAHPEVARKPTGRSSRTCSPWTIPSSARQSATARSCAATKRRESSCSRGPLERARSSESSKSRVENFERVLEAVNELGLEAGQAVLEEWRAEAIKNLRLEA